MELQVGVKVLLKNSAGKFLLLERNIEKYPDMKDRSRWDIVGGRIVPGTALLENLKREIKEETSLDLIAEPKLIAAQDILRPDKHVVRLTYTAEISGEPILNEDHINYKWFSIDELKSAPDIDEYLRTALHFL